MKIAVYGSLRKNEYNHSRMLRYGKMEYIKTTNLKGWDLFSLGPYPGIKPGEGTIVVDLFDVDNDVYKYIYGMEIGAGYIEKEVIIDDEPYKIYQYTGHTDMDDIVHSGDWSKHNNKYVQY